MYVNMFLRKCFLSNVIYFTLTKIKIAIERQVINVFYMKYILVVFNICSNYMMYILLSVESNLELY